MSEAVYKQNGWDTRVHAHNPLTMTKPANPWCTHNVGMPCSKSYGCGTRYVLHTKRPWDGEWGPYYELTVWWWNWLYSLGCACVWHGKTAVKARVWHGIVMPDEWRWPNSEGCVCCAVSPTPWGWDMVFFVLHR